MRPLNLALVVSALMPGCARNIPDATATSQNHSARWTIVTDWPNLPAGFTFGAVSGVASDPRGNIVVLHRADRVFNEAGLADTSTIKTAVVVELDVKTGTVVKTWGANTFLIPHSLTIDPNGNHWITDVGRQQVLKFSNEGRLLLTVGEWRVAGSSRTRFNLPTDVVVMDDGPFFVSDGYRNARIVHFDSGGGYLREWGQKGTGPGQFQTPHGMTRDGSGNLYVADRENFRVQKFNSAGQFMRQWPESPHSSPLFDVAVTPVGLIYAARARAPEAVVILDSDFRQIATIPADSTSRLFGHQLSVVGDSVIYLADTGGRRVVKVVKR